MPRFIRNYNDNYRAFLTSCKLYNLEGDLHISDTQYLICLSIFFIPYALLDVGKLILCTELRC